MLADLYKELVLEHNKNPRNKRKLSAASHAAEGYNPLCGDHLWVEMHIKDDQIDEIAFQGEGCALSTASASIMTTYLQKKSASEAEASCKQVTNAFTGEGTLPEELEALSGVNAFPMRVKCVTLPWHTAKAALNKSQQPVKTEE